MRLKLKPLAYGIMLAIAGQASNPAMAVTMPDSGNAIGAGAAFVGSGTAANPILDVNVSQANSVINWNGSGFNVGSGGTVNFNSSVGPTSILNYDNSGSMSNIQGVVNNGGNKLFLVNPNGISDSSGAFSALIASDPEKVTLGEAGQLNIIYASDKVGGYGSVTGTASKEFNLDVELTQGAGDSGDNRSNIVLGGDTTNVKVTNSSGISLKGNEVKFQANQTNINGSGSIQIQKLYANDIKIEGFDNTTLTSDLAAGDVVIIGNGGSSKANVTQAQGDMDSLTVKDSSLRIDNSDGGDITIGQLTHTATDATSTIIANKANVAIGNANIALVSTDGDSSTIDLSHTAGTSGRLSITGNLSADHISTTHYVDFDNTTFSGFKDLSINDKDFGFSGVTANGANHTSVTTITHSGGTIDNLTVNGGVLNIDSNVQDGVLVFNNLKHHAYIGGMVVDVSNNSSVTFNNIDVNYNSDKDISTDSSFSSAEYTDVGATNSFVATAKGTGGNLTVNGGSIYAEKSIRFQHDAEAGGDLNLSRVYLLSREADIELVKNNEFTTTKEDGENTVEVGSDHSMDTDNKGLIIIDDDEVRDGVVVIQGTAYTNDQKNDGDVDWWQYSSENRVVIDWENTTVDKADIKEGAALFDSRAVKVDNPFSDGGAGGSDEGNTGGDNSGGGSTTPTDPGTGGGTTPTDPDGGSTTPTDPDDGTDNGSGSGSGGSTTNPGTGGGTTPTDPDDGTGGGSGSGSGGGTTPTNPDDGTGGTADPDNGNGGTTDPDDGGSTTDPDGGGSTTNPGDGSSSGGSGSDGSDPTNPDEGSTTNPGGDSGSTDPDGSGTTNPTDPDEGGGSTPTDPDNGSGSETENPGSGGSNPTDPDEGGGSTPTNPDDGSQNPTDPGTGEGGDSTNPGDNGSGGGSTTTPGTDDGNTGSGGTGSGGQGSDSGGADPANPSDGDGSAGNGNTGGDAGSSNPGDSGNSPSAPGSSGSDSNAGSGSVGNGTDTPTNPDTGKPVDPDDGMPVYVDPESPTDPETGLPTNPGPNLPTDPDVDTGSENNGGSNPGGQDNSLPGGAGGGAGQDTSHTTDPNTGWEVDPETGWPVDPETGIPTEPEHTADSGESGGTSSAGAAQPQQAWSIKSWFSSLMGSDDDEKKKKRAAAQAKAREAKAKLEIKKASDISYIRPS
ncbi:beta strand repeat-containing protein [Pseudomonas putida]|uniref:Filamentous hemagglutinin N-terminal domain-containing protein n=1 Tax=Pseudomonas putida TaxID=303 RepID=A0A8I1EBA8_PSEPU|nr:filamentous hemagglutinin N-terminal domain-containing protein [Pseudomonas putida]MBI6882496.1 filamentous hemagglutinin N-terminal domain-containing protein [Pseudomonas putida]